MYLYHQYDDDVDDVNHVPLILGIGKKSPTGENDKWVFQEQDYALILIFKLLNHGLDRLSFVLPLNWL